MHSNRFVPYHKLLDKKFTILGRSETLNDEFLVIEDEKNKSIK